MNGFHADIIRGYDLFSDLDAWVDALQRPSAVWYRNHLMNIPSCSSMNPWRNSLFPLDPIHQALPLRPRPVLPLGRPFLQ